MRPSRTTLAALASVILVLGACSKKDPVLALIDDLEAAVEDKSADEVSERVAADFRGEGGVDRAEAISLLRRYLAGYEKIEADVYDVSVQRGDGSADVKFRVDFSGQAMSIGGLSGLLPPDASYRFDLHVVDQGGTWKVQRADWEAMALPADAPPAPGR
jgi:hypothetical protein